MDGHGRGGEGLPARHRHPGTAGEREASEPEGLRHVPFGPRPNHAELTGGWRRGRGRHALKSDGQSLREVDGAGFGADGVYAQQSEALFEQLVTASLREPAQLKWSPGGCGWILQARAAQRHWKASTLFCF